MTPIFTREQSAALDDRIAQAIRIVMGEGQYLARWEQVTRHRRATEAYEGASARLARSVRDAVDGLKRASVSEAIGATLDDGALSGIASAASSILAAAPCEQSIRLECLRLAAESYSPIAGCPDQPDALVAVAEKFAAFVIGGSSVDDIGIVADALSRDPAQYPPAVDRR